MLPFFEFIDAMIHSTSVNWKRLNDFTVCIILNIYKCKNILLYVTMLKIISDLKMTRT